MGVALVKARIDVLLAAYDGEAYLPQQLTSLERQLLREFRVLWQDDGSSDGTATILREASSRDSRFVAAQRQGEHLGPCGNFISLLRQSDAPYCALCDQDDVWAPDHLLSLMSMMEKAEAESLAGTPLLVYSDCSLIDGAGRVLHPSMCLHQGWRLDALPLKELLVQTNATGCTMLMNAPLRKLVAEHAPEVPFMHDWIIALVAACFGGSCFVRMPLVDHRVHEGNVIGASRGSLPARALRAVRHGDAVRERIARSYHHARLLLDAWGEIMPEGPREAVEGYLATRELPKLQRVMAVRRGGYRMQRPLFRLAQLIWG